MKISAILSNIEQEQFALPEFQRGYVWGREDVRNLFDSLYRRYPVGGFLVWTTQPDPQTVRGDAGQTGGAVKLLLDGQQRATSLFGVVHGRPPDFFQGNEKAFTDLYFNVETETFEFYGPVKMADDPLWVSVTDLFNSEFEQVVHQFEQRSGNFPLITYIKRLNRLLEIRETDLHIEEIAGDDLSVDEVVEIFNRVNSGGTKLSSADLALARLCAHSPQVRNELRRLLGDWERAQFSFRQEWLLRCATAVATNQASFNSLREVSVSEFDAALKKAAQSIEFILNLFGDRLGIDHSRVLAGPYALAALIRMVSERGGSVTDHQTQQRMLFWYMHCFMWGRYSASTETKLQRDLHALEAGGIDSLIRELEQWRGSLTVQPDDFDSSSIGARFYPLLYILTRVNSSRDLFSGIQLSHALLGQHSKLQVHHIFPKKRLYDASYSRSQVNALANFCFLTALGNQSISAADPARYLAEAEADNPGVLASQWIPQDEALWQIDRYPDFLAARRTLLADAANELLRTLREGIGTPAQPVGGRAAAASEKSPLAFELQPAEDEAEDQEIRDVLALASELGIAAPETHYEICDDTTDEVLAVADIAWPQGIQPGRPPPVAFLIDADAHTEEQLGELGYRFFTTKARLVWHLEELLGIDIDGDQIVGEIAKDGDS
ncbi:GmrSD restriction endonuclease domain-containing protein [Candidatus Poriferisodalis sp.]|uniref:GmrSD restriction endonuclease domain-containing protein n=1 Tax=Candidatus Poriferisodalis sp. TaxID=3101277 RepID=UPI003B01B2E7